MEGQNPVCISSLCPQHAPFVSHFAPLSLFLVSLLLPGSNSILPSRVKRLLSPPIPMTLLYYETAASFLSLIISLVISIRLFSVVNRFDVPSFSWIFPSELLVFAL